MADSEEPKPNDGKPAHHFLPMVVAPKLDGSEESFEDEAMNDTLGSASSAPLSRPLRFTLLAAAIAVAAAIGSLSASGVAHLWSGNSSSGAMADASKLQAIKAELAELSALKANLDNASRNVNTQFAKITDRLDRVERAEVEPVVKLTHIAEAVDRLEKKAAASPAPAAPETTGSIGNGHPAAPAEARSPDKVLPDWVVQEVRSGHVLVASRYGGVFEVVTGAVLPGLGRVETIKRQDGQWVVVTERGLITAH